MSLEQSIFAVVHGFIVSFISSLPTPFRSVVRIVDYSVELLVNNRDKVSLLFFHGAFLNFHVPCQLSFF